MPFAHLDHASIVRSLSQIAGAGEAADVYFERREDLELPPDDETPGLRRWREEGLAVRLVRGGQAWLAGRDGIDGELFYDALRRAARAMPRAPYPKPEISIAPWQAGSEADELLEFPSLLRRAVASHKLDVVPRVSVRRHRRWSRVLGTRLSSATEHEAFFSVAVELPWGARCGALLNALGNEGAQSIAQRVARAVHAREAEPPEPGKLVCVLGPEAAAVLLHEAVAHALETDTLALSGHPEAAIGVPLGSEALDVFDDPTSAPQSVRRSADDEGYPVMRRCLLRAGKVEQPLCDTLGERQSERLTAGAGRRGNRHQPPAPRSFHLVLAARDTAFADLLADAEGGLYLPEAERGHLDPLTGEFQLHFPHARRIHEQQTGATVGPGSLSGRVGDLLTQISAVGSDARVAGAGWCAKGGVKLPVWATSPALRIDRVAVKP